MIVIGAKGFAKEVLEVLHQRDPEQLLAFYDDVNDDVPDLLYGRYPVLRSTEQARDYMEAAADNRFTIGIGNPVLRQQLFGKFSAMGGEFSSTVSPFAHIGHFGNNIRRGCNIMTGTVITNSVSLGIGCLINLNCTIGHDCVIGDFVEMSPTVNISGNCTIGDLVTIGTNATLLPGITVGRNAVIGAGSVVTKDVPENTLVVGVPAKVIRTFDASQNQ